MNYSNSDFYFPPEFVDNFGLPSSLQLNVTPLNWVDPNDPYINTATEATHVMGNAVNGSPPTNSDPSSLSMESSGQLYFPGIVSHETCDNTFGSYSSYPQHVEPAQYDHAPYPVPLDFDNVVPSTQYYDTSQVEYLDQSMYRTDWELQTHLHANSQTALPMNHIDAEMLNYNISQFDVRQSSQELGYPPASGYETTQSFEPYSYPLHYDASTQGVDPATHDSHPSEAIIPLYPHPETTATTAPYFSNPDIWNSYAPFSVYSSAQSYPVASTDDAFPLATIPSELYPFQPDSAQEAQLTAYGQLEATIPIPQFYASPSSFTFNAPSYPVIPTDDILPPIAPTPYLYPSQHDLPQGAQPQNLSTTQPLHPYAIPELTQATSTTTIPSPPYPNNSRDLSPASSFPSPSYPITPIDDTPPPLALATIPALPPACRTPKKTRPSPPPKKRARSPKKASPVFITPIIFQREKTKGKRRSPYEGAQVKSEDWIKKYFPTRERCTMCEEENKKYKAPEPCEEEKKPRKFRNDRALEHLVSTHVFQIIRNMRVFDKEALARAPRHLLETEDQFVYAREQLNKIKCSLCPRESSLTFRNARIRDHLRTVHADLPESVHQEELERLRAVIPDKTEWYSFQDKFLHCFPGRLKDKEEDS